MRHDRSKLLVFASILLVLTVTLGWWGYQGAVQSTAKAFARFNNELVRKGYTSMTLLDAVRPHKTSTGQVWPLGDKEVRGDQACASDCIAQRALTPMTKFQLGGSLASLFFLIGVAGPLLSPNTRRNLINLDRHRVRITNSATSLPVIQAGRQQWGPMRRDRLKGSGRREMGSLFVIGAPGRGKSSLLKYWLTTADELNFVVVDLKGDLWTATAGHREELGPVYRLDLTRMEGDAFDPFDTDDEARVRAVLEVFLPTDSGNTNANYFNAQAGALALAYWRAARRTGQSAMPIIVDAATRPPAGAVELAQGLIALAPEAARNGLLKSFESAFGARWKDPEEGGGNERNSVLQSFRGAFEGLNVPEILSTLSQTTFDPASLVEERATVYITAPSTSAPYKIPVELLLGGVIEAITSHVDTQRASQQGQDIVLLADEAGILRIPGLTEILAGGRSRGLTVAAFFQSMGQLDEYHPKGFKGLVDLSHHWTWFSSSDPQTHEFLRGQCGAYDVRNPSRDADERNRRPTVEVMAYDDVRPRWREGEVIALLDYDRKHTLMGKFVSPYGNRVAEAAMRKSPPLLPTLAAAPAVQVAPPSGPPPTTRPTPSPKAPVSRVARMQIRDEAAEEF